ncbi:bluetail domain-containing putative surface protein, partial [Cyanobium sp. Lug-B]|uniref:beta strand repeat-containing protein n=1 Tax=Cyanobium sp. Lug-B TaxID=2823716 RepID=UPI0020CC82BC
NDAVNQLNDGQLVTEVFNVATTDGGSASVTINITGTNDVATLNAIADVNLPENATSGTLITTASGSDIDSANLTYSLINTPDNGSGPLFAIGSTTGAITLTAAGAGAIDYETATKSYTLHVQVSDGGATDTKFFTINLTNVNDTSPTFSPIGGTDNTISAAEIGTQITGTVESVVTQVTVTIGDVTRTAILNGSTWSYTLTAADITNLMQGTDKTITATAKDAADTTTQATSAPFAIDTLPPAAPSLALGTGVAGGATASEATQPSGVVTISGESGSSLSVIFSRSGGGTVTKTLTGIGAPQAVVLTSYDLTTLGDGSISVSATTTDAAGNLSSAGTTSFSVDTVAPTAPTIRAIATDNIINATEATAGVTLSGTTEAGTSVSLNVAGQTRTALLSGTTWSYAFTNTDLSNLGQGSGKTVVITAADAAGNTTSTTSQAFAIDTLATTISSVAIASASGIQNSTLNAGDVVTAIVTTSSAVTVSGTPQLRLNIGGVLVNASYASGSGTNSLAFTYTIQAGQKDTNGISINASSLLLNGGTITDAAGKAVNLSFSTISGNPGYKVDTTAPTVTSVAITSAAGIQNSTLNAGDVVTATVTTSEVVTVNAAGGPPQLQLNIGGTLVNASYASGSGTNRLTFTYTIQAGQTDVNGISIDASSLSLNVGTITDAAGNNASLNFNAVTDKSAYKVDTTAPNAPSLSLATDSGSNGTDRITNSGVVNVTGLEPGATWQYSTNGTSWVNGSGISFTLTGNGPKTMIVRQKDLAGNLSVNSAPVSFTLDTTAAAPTLSLATDSGRSNSDRITNLGSVNVSGLESGAAWRYSLDNATTWTPGIGTSFTLTGDGTKTAIVQQTDLAGNTSNSSAALSFTLDATAPAIPTLSLDTDSGTYNNDGITNSGGVNVTGLEASAIWQYSTNGGTTWVNGSGSTFTLTGNGAKNVIVRQTDVAGNTTTTPTPFTFTIDTTAPAAPTLSFAATADYGTSNAVTFSGTAQANSVVNIYSGSTTGTTIATAAANGSGQWSTDWTPDATGLITFNANATDLAGNTSSAASQAVDIQNGTSGPDIFAAVTSTISRYLSGQSQDDTINGGAGKDFLFGGSANDVLSGGAGDDLLNGGSDSDTLIGGSGKDVHTGGSGSDVFRYTALNESLLAIYDVITDYAGEDKIDAPSSVPTPPAGTLTLSATGNVVTDLTSAEISNLFTSKSVGANQAIAFTVSAPPFAGSTFIAFNNGTPAFSATTDSILQLQNYTGTVSII